MDIVQHLTTLVSIVVGLGLTEMFGRLLRLIHNRARVQWDGLPIAWAATSIVMVLNYWWGLYAGASGLDQVTNAGQFGLLLVPPILLFLTTASVLPQFEAGDAWDMGDVYAAQRRTVIITFILYQLATWASVLAAGAFSWNHVSFIRLAIIAVLALMLLINRRRMDWIGVGLIFGMLVWRLSTQRVL